jgi:predicted PurR-regulated permease PerM
MSPLFRAFFFAALVFFLWQLWVVFEPFLPAFLWAATFTLAFFPVFAALRRRLPTDAAALLASAAVMAGVVVPLTLLGYELARESVALAPAARAWLDAAQTGDTQQVLRPSTSAAWDAADSALEPLGFTSRGLFLQTISRFGHGLGHLAARAAREILLLTLGLVVLGVSLFFTFRHGEDWMALATELVPMPPNHKRAVVRTVSQTFTTVVRGVLANSTLQGLAAGLAFAAAGLKFPVFLGVAAGLASLIPFVGTSLVWGPACITLFLRGDPAAWALLAWCLLVVVALDRFVKPRLMGEPAKTALPELTLFFSIVGGVDVFGPNGLLLGPLLIATALAFVRIYRQEFQAR